MQPITYRIIAGTAAGGALAAVYAWASARSRRALPFLPALCLAVLVLGYAADWSAAGIPRVQGSMWADDSGGKKPDSVGVDGERRQTPSTWTPHQLDSLFKHLNIYVEFIGDTAGRHVNRDVVMALLENQHYRGRDSAFVFQGDDCIRIELRLGLTAGVKDTILWTNQCDDACFDSLTIPVGCWETETTVIEDTVTTQICDTICVQTLTYTTPLNYLAYSAAGAASLFAYAGCADPPAGTYFYKLVLYNGQWYQPVDTARHHHFVPATDSCYVDGLLYQLWIWTTMSTWSAGATGLGPWHVDSLATVTGQQEVDCSMYGQAGVSRVLTNCRDTLLTVQKTFTREVWIDAGRDTTIWTDLCDCLVPRFVCTEQYDTLWQWKYIYEYLYTRDSIPCEREYVIPIYDYYLEYQTAAYTVCRSELDSNYHKFKDVLYLHGTTTRTSADQRHIRAHVPFADTCWTWSCVTTDDLPSQGYQDWWVRDVYLDAEFPCPPPVCTADSVGYYTITGNCCPKDTTETYYCWPEHGEDVDSVTVTYTVPTRDGSCNEWTYDNWVIYDSLLIDSLRYFDEISVTTEYILTYEDTCCVEYTINGKPWPCDLWIIRDCEPQLYWGTYSYEHGVLRIPCEPATAYPDEGYISDQVEYVNHRLALARDTIGMLRDSVTRTTDTLNAWRAMVYADGGSGGAWTVSAETVNFEPSDQTHHLVDVSGGNISATLPAAASAFEFVIKRTDDGSSGNTLTIVGTIDGSENPTVAAGTAYRIVSDGTNWYFIGTYP